MNVLLFLIPLALALGLIALAGFFWALKSGQFEDLEGPACRILEDDKQKNHKLDQDQDMMTNNK